MPVNDAAVADLLSGPRGLRMCMCVLTSRSPTLHTTFQKAWMSGGPDLLSDLLGELADVDTASIAAELDESALVEPLSQAVNAARYWQQPDEQDDLLADLAVRAALRPTAETLAGAPAAAWWSSPIDFTCQRYVQWLDERPTDPPSLAGAKANLETWRAATLEDERRSAKRPSNPRARYSGQWWSTPAFAGLTTTSRELPGLGAAKLALIEDGLGWARASVWPLAPASACRIYEITGPESWADLAARYPLEVSASKRHDWWRATGVESAWFIPDWTRVAVDFDAVHLTVTGYLTTAGRALPVGKGHTVLAGWNPDETYWLVDVLKPDGPPVEWHRSDSQEANWTAVDD